MQMSHQARLNRVFLVTKFTLELSLLVVDSLFVGLDVALVDEKLATDVTTMLKRIEYLAIILRTTLGWVFLLSIHSPGLVISTLRASLSIQRSGPGLFISTVYG